MVKLPFTLPPGCEVVGHTPVFEQGCFRKDVVYVIGIHRERELPRIGPTSFVDGLRGKETRVIASSITPIGVFDVLDPQS
jgi:hypothetical protein